MKRIIALLLVLVMALTLCACHKNEDPTLEPEYKDGKTSGSSDLDLSAFEGKLLKPYIELIASGNYYFKISSAEGGEEEMFTQIGKDKMISIKSQGYDFIKKGDGTLYCVTGSQYVELNTKNLSVVSAETAQLVDSLKLVFDQSEKLVSDMVTMTPTDKASSLAVKDYRHEEYVDKWGILYSFFFDNSDALVAYARIESQTNYSLTVVEFGTPSPNAISNIFLNYTQVDAGDVSSQQQTTTTTTQAPTTTKKPVATTAAPAAPAATAQPTAPVVG
ncbi:MAG: hypothetical protein MJ111_03140 [Clostridia bacterium]|nr:hypothetical protein [Clostridia bacterium]